ncbi:hypothetical protein [Thalassotalea sp. ND16A]|uniref:hypothetical protein n=1 Tax=Thalassotalea sp. ND16A TaxID=1535422 RepID=UPI00051CF5E1|nr:hypothetical protein [Thalassotalea sp. ND16A]KGJ99282.1 hypothetical protein ND16A_3803 [Thalassotalea sp. ND16A]
MKRNTLTTAVVFAATCGSVQAAQDINISAIVNVGYTEREDFQGIAGFGVDEHAAGLKSGFWTDHTELAISAPIDDMFFGKMTMVLDEHDGETEIELEEAFIQTTGLDYDLSLRAGRFLSNVGYLNGKHTHTDSFADRPLLYRAFMNGHYFDDGARLSWLAPTDVYLELGSELFKGGKMPAYASGDGIGAQSLFVKTGGDFNHEHSWQLGVSYLGFDNDEGFCSDHGHEEEHEEEHHEEHDAGALEDEHEEGFGACAFSGEKDYYIVDAVWKWAPNGNYKYQNFTLSAEYFRVEEKGELLHQEEHHDENPALLEEHHDPIDAEHSGFYLSAVYQFSPNWATGLRYSEIDFDEPYSHGFTPSVSTAMLEYRHSHFSTVRIQYSQDKSTEHLSDDQITLQFSMALGAHGAHQF